MDDRKLDKLEKLITLVDEDYVKSDEFVEAFGMLTGLLKEVSEHGEETCEDLKNKCNEIREVVLSERKLTRKLQEQFNNRLSLFKTELENAIYEVSEQIPELRQAVDGRDGKDGKDGKDGSPDTGEEIIVKINKVDEKGPKIDAKHIKNLPEATQTIIQQSYPGGFVETPIKAGANITITTDSTGAKVITGSAGGGGTWGSITGTLSDQTDLQTALDAKANALGADDNYVTDAEKVKLGNLSGTNTGDQTSIVGITGTKAQFDTAVTDGNFLYVGDITQYTDELAQDAVGAMVDTTLVYTDGTPLLSRAALTGDVTASAGSNTTTIAAGAVDIAMLSATGTPDNTTYLRGDNTWATIAGGGDVSKVGTPANNQIGVWTGDGTIEGDASLTWDGTSFNIATAKNFQIAGGTVLADSAGTLTLSGIDAIDATTEATIEGAIDTLANLTSIQGRTVTLADAGADALLGWDDSASAYQNLSAADAKTALSLAKGDVGLGNVDNTSDANKPVSSATQTALDLKADLASPTFTGTVILPKTLEIQDTTGDHQYILAVSELAADRTVTLPLLTGADEFVFKAHAQTLTNKTLTSPKINEDVAVTATATELNILDGATLTTTELNYVDGVTSAIQTQLDAKGTGNVSKVGTPVAAQISVWTGDGTIAGNTAFTYQNAGGTPTVTIGGAGDRAAIVLSGDTSGTTTIVASAVAGTTTVTLPAATDTLVGKDTTDTLTNKTLTSPTLTTPVLGTPSSGTLTNCTGLPLAGVVDSTTEALGVGSLELGHASDTTLTRVSAGVVAIEGVNVLTTAGGTLTGNITLGENTSIDLDPAGSADGKYSGVCITGTAGAALAFGDLIYLAAADSRWELADADAASTADRMLGICVLAAAGDGSATKILLHGNIRADAAFPALTIGSPVYVGETAGDVQTAIPTGADNVIRRVGYALTADELYFCPSMDSQVTVA